jgi:hypothetical protein
MERRYIKYVTTLHQPQVKRRQCQREVFSEDTIKKTQIENKKRIIIIYIQDII